MRKALLAFLVAGGVVVGVWALVAPASFYADFGLTQGWVQANGAFNEHLIRDVGGLNLAIAVLTAAAWVIADARLDRAVAVAWLVYGVPHLTYHATHLEALAAVDAVAQLASLSLYVVAPLLLLLLPAARPRPAGAAV